MKSHLRYRPRFDILETRLVPATLVNANTVVYSDLAGEKVTVTLSQPLFDVGTINSVFTFDTGDVDEDPANDTPQILNLLDLTGLAAAGATLSITPTKTNKPAVGRIDATGLDLAAMKLGAIVGELDVGDADLATPALGLLKLESLTSPTFTTVSNIQGSIDKLRIREELGDSFLDVNGSIGTAVIGRMDGTSGDDSARLHVNGDLGSLLVQDSIRGHNGGQRSGWVQVGGDIGSVTVFGDVEGMNDDSGQITANGDIGSVTITGLLRLNPGFGISGENAARINSEGNIGKVKIGGNVEGEEGGNSGSISTDGSIQSVKIGGDLVGGDGPRSGRIHAQEGSIGQINIGGSLRSGTGSLSGLLTAFTSIDKVTIGGDVQGSDADHPAGIVAQGDDLPTEPVIGKVVVQGKMEFGTILAGYGPNNLVVEEADAQIGKVKIGGDLIASLIAAGVNPEGDNLLATADDALFIEGDVGEEPLARIGKITIGGLVVGSAAAGDHFGIVAQEIGSLKISGVPLALTAGPSNDVLELAIGVTDDVTVREV